MDQPNLTPLLIPVEFAKSPNVDELKAKISALEQRIEDLERVQKDDVVFVENYGPKSHALFHVSAKLGKELLFYNALRGERPLFSFHPSLTLQGTKMPGWVIMDKTCRQEATDLLTALKVKYVPPQSQPTNKNILQMMGM